MVAALTRRGRSGGAGAVRGGVRGAVRGGSGDAGSWGEEAAASAC